MSRYIARARFGLVLAFCALLLVAACGGAKPAGFGAYAPQPGSSGANTLDDQYAAIARKVPGFAGLHHDAEKGITYISLRDPALKAEAEQAVTDMFGAEVLKNRTVVVQVVEYDFPQLSQWYERLGEHVWQVKSVSWTDIDEKANRIRIGVGTLEGKAQLEEAVRRAGVPPLAVIIDIPEGALSEANPLAGCQLGEKPPLPEERSPYALRASAETASPEQEITLTVEGTKPQVATRGIDSYLECWDGLNWSPRFILFSERGTDGPHAIIYSRNTTIPALGIDATRPANLKLPGQLSPGWYRIRIDVSVTESGTSVSHALWTLVLLRGTSGR